MNVYIHKPVNYSDMQGPAPSGFHVPTKDEAQSLIDAGITLGAWTASNGDNAKIYLKMPYSGNLYPNSGQPINTGDNASFWCCDSGTNFKNFGISSTYFIVKENFERFGFSIRPFKNTSVVPDSSWTELYTNGIYHNSTLGLISVKNGSSWITISDKNLGATNVYNNGDTMSESNCGKFYQFGNNYGFAYTGATTTSSTAVDASNYGPGNYYSSSTWIKTNPRDSSNNKNLRGGVSGVGGESELKNAYIGGKYMGEYIKYKMNADSNGNLYVPIGGINTTGASNAPYNWKVSVDGGSETTYSGTGNSGGKITISGYTANSSHTIKITPTTEDYLWARAYGWYDTGVANLLTEIIYDGSYMGYGESATSTGDNFRAMQYTGCTSITKPADENIPNTVTTIGDRFRNDQYESCTALLYSAEEDLPSSVTSIGTYFRYFQYYGCTAIKEIKGWKDLSIGNSSNYRAYQYTNCNTNKTVKVLSNVGYNADSNNGLNNTYVTSVYVPSTYLSNFTGTSYRPRTNITDSKFIGY